jgi:hypothetical protein
MIYFHIDSIMLPPCVHGYFGTLTKTAGQCTLVTVIGGFVRRKEEGPDESIVCSGSGCNGIWQLS